jgi:hypothetical protein
MFRQRRDKILLTPLALYRKATTMNTNWAEENLSLIRTLMERASIYRRALAPIMITTGVIGASAAVVGLSGKLDAATSFLTCWASAAIVALFAGFLLARREALREREAFWSPPTRRVAIALLPAGVGGIIAACAEPDMARLAGWWLLIYGCGLHGAGFFMPSGVRRLSWIFIIAGALALVFGKISPHAVMGVGFGGLHLAYGIYLYATRTKPTSL